ncbi:hypothetical protein [Phaeacidiphilus oryzae]|uniref:hypothetical protein n=1 Tax=Phaeacidiphilus oryzae TaxID=348818 RepID=UPI001269B41E|nr:hypothetical protein [Phaeacidiphilus oryzae]
MASPRGGAHDPVALDEIELYGELMIAAAATGEERLPKDRIDEVLRVGDAKPPSSPPEARVPTPRDPAA